MSYYQNSISNLENFQRSKSGAGSVALIDAVDKNTSLKNGIWLYFFLLIFEGALRKWALPGLSTPLLIIRDPIALWIVIKAWNRNLLPSSNYLTATIIIGLLSIFTAIFWGHGNIAVALFGARILLIHFPLMFAIGGIFTRADVIKLAKASLLIAIPMAVLIGLQFYSPQSAWVNRGVGGDTAGAGFSGALGYFRPPGTFSFTSGTTSFFIFIAPLVFYFWISSEVINKILLVGATLALLVSIPLSISRALFFGVLVTILFVMLAALSKPKYLGRIIVSSLIIIVALWGFSQLPFFQTATEAFTSRFLNANESEGGTKGVLFDRYLGGMVGALSVDDKLPFWGYGSGMGTNVGSQLLTGKVSFLISEGEWGRLIGELGPLMGMFIILIRLGFSATVAVASYRKLIKGDFLPWLLLANLLLVVPQGQWGQPTSLGFSTLIGGLIIASLSQRNKIDANTKDQASKNQSTVQ